MATLIRAGCIALKAVRQASASSFSVLTAYPVPPTASMIFSYLHHTAHSDFFWYAILYIETYLPWLCRQPTGVLAKTLPQRLMQKGTQAHVTALLTREQPGLQQPATTYKNLPAIRHKGCGYWVLAESARCCPSCSSSLQCFRAAVAAIDPVVIQHYDNNWQLVPAPTHMQVLRKPFCKRGGE